MAKVIYILGAGASAKSLPIVNEIPLFFEIFHDWIEWYMMEVLHKPNTGELLDFFSFAMEQIEESLQYPSPDTYARVLKLKNEVDNYRKFNTFLSLFFLWKESMLAHDYGLMTIDDSFEHRLKLAKDGKNPLDVQKRILKPIEERLEHFNKPELRSKFRYNIDPRYFGFFSTILDNCNDKKISKDIGIISWNYDTQIERTLRLFGSEIPAENYIKLNGDVSFKNLKVEDFYKIVGPNIPDFIQMVSNFSTLESNIQYSWDHLEGQNDERLMNLFMDTKKVIIIGYSFPVYNRITDTNIFRIMQKYTVERIGVPLIQIVGKSEETFKKHKSSLVSLLQGSDWSISDSTDYIRFLNSPDQFPIPLEIGILGKEQF